MLFLLPVLLVIVTGQVIHTVLDPSRLPIALVDLDNTDYSRLVMDRVAESPLLLAYTTDEETALRQVVTGRKEAAVILEDGFMENIIAGRVEGIIRLARSPSSISAGVVGEVASAEVLRLTGNVMAADMVLEQYVHYLGEELGEDLGEEHLDRDKIWNEAWAFSDELWEPPRLMRLQYRETGNGEMDDPAGVQPGFGSAKEKTMVLLGLLTAGIMFLMLFLNGWLVEEKACGIAARLRSTAIKPALYLAGNSLAVVAVALLSTLIVLALIGTVISPAILFSFPVLTLLLVYTGACYSIAFFIAAFSGNMGQLQAIGIPVVLVTSLFGGSFFNLTELTGRFSLLARLTPQAWALEGLREALYTSGYFGGVGMPVLALLCATFIFLILGWKMGIKQ